LLGGEMGRWGRDLGRREVLVGVEWGAVRALWVWCEWVDAGLYSLKLRSLPLAAAQMAAASPQAMARNLSLLI
jgi:hypothetical protein